MNKNSLKNEEERQEESEPSYPLHTIGGLCNDCLKYVASRKQTWAGSMVENISEQLLAQLPHEEDSIEDTAAEVKASMLRMETPARYLLQKLPKDVLSCPLNEVQEEWLREIIRTASEATPDARSIHDAVLNTELLDLAERYLIEFSAIRSVNRTNKGKLFNDMQILSFAESQELLWKGGAGGVMEAGRHLILESLKGLVHPGITIDEVRQEEQNINEAVILNPETPIHPFEMNVPAVLEIAIRLNARIKESEPD